MSNKERRERRYQRRRNKRTLQREKRLAKIGTLEEVFAYHKMFKYGKDCCSGVRWKRSVQEFELHLFSRTSCNHKNVINGYHSRSLYRFKLKERGKIRDIEAPFIDDRQIHKTLTKEVLMPLYLPYMIYDNGASLKGKGLTFSQLQFDKVIRRHYKKYGMSGSIIIADCSGFFPNADRDVVKSRHQKIPDRRIAVLIDYITDIGNGTKGLPIGVETAQLEMISLPSALDHYIACQVGLPIGHYMDDFHIMVPPDRNPQEIAEIFIQKASTIGLTFKPQKVRIYPFGKPIKFCKSKRIWITETKIIKRGCPDSIKRTRRKIHSFSKLKLSYFDIYQSINASFAYLDNFNNHKAKIRLTRLFYALYNYSPLDIEKARGLDEIHNAQKI